MAMSRYARSVGAAVMKAGAEKTSTWFTPHMATASRAIFERIPLVDITLEVRDARVTKTPLSFIASSLSRFRELKFDKSKFTITVMLVGIPNVEKGKLKHATVSPLPGEIKLLQDVTVFINALVYAFVQSYNNKVEFHNQIACYPNIYVLDALGVLHPDSIDIEMGSKLALTCIFYSPKCLVLNTLE
ncbi:hypothetical protein IFM89_034574 [Coptis chinensis]|uniref:Uncharacterized protein n=1 Tax=Coptis chinensis TaxID=261450 RepID=A0A835HP85_9MAGN|nr:hypothetical protein IFM89_034574 [Coptis chinensis]